MKEIESLPLIKEPSLKLLIGLIIENRPKSILEIGTCIGYSGIEMLKASDATLTTIEIDEERAKIALTNFTKERFKDRVNLIVGDATEILLEKTIKEKFDFIFLDGPKAQYVRQLPCLIDLLQVGGVLFADNVLFRGYVRNPKSAPRRFKTIVSRLNSFIDDCNNSERLENVEIKDIGDGILIATKKGEI